jgi:hypothetical protein
MITIWAFIFVIFKKEKVVNRRRIHGIYPQNLTLSTKVRLLNGVIFSAARWFDAPSPV